jgi:hypothetical protein
VIIVTPLCIALAIKEYLEGEKDTVANNRQYIVVVEDTCTRKKEEETAYIDEKENENSFN